MLLLVRDWIIMGWTQAVSFLIFFCDLDKRGQGCKNNLKEVVFFRYIIRTREWKVNIF